MQANSTTSAANTTTSTGAANPPVSPPSAPVAGTPTLGAVSTAVAVTPVAAAFAARATVGGATPRLGRNMLCTLQALATVGACGPHSAITHNQLMALTGRAKGNQLRPLLAWGYTHTALAAGTRGYVYSITPAGLAALGAAGAVAIAPVAPAPVPVAPPVPSADLASGFGLDTPAAVTAPVVAPVEPSAPTLAQALAKYPAGAVPAPAKPKRGHK